MAFDPSQAETVHSRISNFAKVSQRVRQHFATDQRAEVRSGSKPDPYATARMSSSAGCEHAAALALGQRCANPRTIAMLSLSAFRP
jgi:hypothetical protein